MVDIAAVRADALNYRQNKSACERGDWRDYSVSGADLEVLVSVLDGERAMVFNADRASNIEVVMGLASDFNLGAIIIGGAEAWPSGRRFQPAVWPSEPENWTV